MNRAALQAALDGHAAADSIEAASLQRIRRFVAAPADPFARENPEGHVTGSAVVARPDGSAFLLVHHRRLGRWLQPGGHTEPSDASVFETARREAREETGIEELADPLAGAILDVDVHAIPARGAEAAHSHFDVRYLFTSEALGHACRAEDPARPMVWMSFEKALGFGVDGSLARALSKARRKLRGRGA